MSATLINATASAITSNEVTLLNGDSEVLFLAKGLQGTEQCDIQIKAPDGSWVSLKVQGSFGITAGTNSINIQGRQFVRVVKPITQAPVTIYVIGADHHYSIS